MAELMFKKCVPCESNTPPLKEEEIISLITELGASWKVINDHHLEKEYLFKDFKEALAFTNKVGELAEAEGHHPDINLSYGKVRLVLWTHNIKGLSENDFILAAKCDEIR
jgi:4a-hydroxytetrahydrobiopterin dehydratase